MSRIPSANAANTTGPDKTSPLDSRSQLVDGLRQQLGRCGAIAAEESAVFSCGAEAVDRLLPAGGLRPGMLVEWLGASGAATLGLLGAREACREGGVLVVVDRARTFYPPAAEGWGIDLERLIVVYPQTARDELWAAVQALRSPVVAALWTCIDRLDGRAFRRLQLAAETGRTLGVLVRPVGARGQPTWAGVRLEVENFGFRISDFGLTQPIRNPQSRVSSECRNQLTRRALVRVVHCHGGRPGNSAALEIDDASYTVRQARSTHDSLPLRLATELADSTGRSRPARA